MDVMLMTLAMFQAPIGWLNLEAPANMADMSVTFAVFQSPIG